MIFLDIDGKITTDPLTIALVSLLGMGQPSTMNGMPSRKKKATRAHLDPKNSTPTVTAEKSGIEKFKVVCDPLLLMSTCKMCAFLCFLDSIRFINFRY